MALRIESSTPSDIPRLMDIIVPAFSSMPYERLVGHVDTPEGRKAAGIHHLRAWTENTSSIKCIYSDSRSGEETIAATAEWVIYRHERSWEAYSRPTYLLSADWVEDADSQRTVREIVRPLQEYRIRWLGGRPHALLLYMATDPKFRRMGAATQCVKWGLERCKELDIPAYLEASEDGVKVYERLGFEVVDWIPKPNSGEDRLPSADKGEPVMIWWPPGTKDEEKRAALPGCMGRVGMEERRTE